MAVDDYAHASRRLLAQRARKPVVDLAGLPIQRVGEKLGVLVVQSKEARAYSEDEIYALEVVAMVLAEMTELGLFAGDVDGMRALHKQPVMIRGGTGQEGAAEGRVWLHEARVVVTNPVADDPLTEIAISPGPSPSETVMHFSGK